MSNILTVLSTIGGRLLYQLCACKYYLLFTIIFLLEHVFKFYRHFQINVFYKRQLENNILLRNIAPSLRLSSIFLKETGNCCACCMYSRRFLFWFNYDIIPCTKILYYYVLLKFQNPRRWRNNSFRHQKESIWPIARSLYNGYFSQ